MDEAPSGELVQPGVVELHAVAPLPASALHLVPAQSVDGAHEGAQRAVDSLPIVALCVDFRGTVLSSNTASRTAPGFAASAVLGRPLTAVLDEAGAHGVSAALTAMAAGNLDHAHVVASMPADHGQVIDVAMIVAVVRDGTGSPACAVVLLRDRSQQDRDHADLRFRAYHDALTDLPNRPSFVERLGQAMARARRQRSWSAVLFIDLDGFKGVNDTLGHGVGDELLFSAAGRISAVMRPEDTLARYGGDEFIVLCEDLHGPGEADAIAARVRAVFAAGFLLSAGEASLSASIGVAVVANGDADPTAVVAVADAAMYASKQDGGDRYVVRRMAR